MSNDCIALQIDHVHNFECSRRRFESTKKFSYAINQDIYQFKVSSLNKKIHHLIKINFSLIK
jgi:DNA-binding transcriptional regulator GbsR (MarR family)